MPATPTASRPRRGTGPSGSSRARCQARRRRKAVWLDLRHGQCHGTATSDAARQSDAPFEIAAAYPVWTEVLAGRLDPVMGMMLGKLKLTGPMAQIAAHAGAAKQLVACAASVETTAPDG